MKTVRWGIIGAGDVCERKSGPPLYKVDRSELVLVHRRDRTAGEDFARRHAGRYVGSVDELIASEEIDAVYVATPHALHAEQTIAALRAGKHVLVEKPMALSAAECTAMIDAAAEAGRALGVAYYRRGYPSIQKIRDLIDAATIGTITAMSLNGQFPTSHRLDLVHYLLGDIESVRMVSGNDDGFRFERSAGRIQARVRRGNSHATITMSDTYAETGMPEALILHGDAGSIYLTDLKGGSITVTRTGADGSTELERIETGGLPYTHWGLVENYVSHIIDSTPLLCDGTEGRKSTVALDALAEADAGVEGWIAVEGV